MSQLHALVCGEERTARQAADDLLRQGTDGDAESGAMTVMIASLSCDIPPRLTLSGDLFAINPSDGTFWRKLAGLMGARPDDGTIERIVTRLKPGGAVVLAHTVSQANGKLPSGAPGSANPGAGVPKVPSAFARFAGKVSWLAGSPSAFALAMALIVVWAATGPIFSFSDTWQLVINTGTTVVTFLMVFVIQNAQNRDGEAIQVKLDELVRATENARNTIIGIEKLGDAHVRALEAELEAERGDNDVAEEPEENIR